MPTIDQLPTGQDLANGDDAPINLATAALAVLQPNPAASVFHRLMLVSLAAIADPMTGAVGVVRDVELAKLLRLPGSITRPTRQWLINNGHLIETRASRKGQAGTVRLGDHLVRLANPSTCADHPQPTNERTAA